MEIESPSVGTESVSSSVDTSPSNTPTPIDIGEDTLVRLPGMKEPVKYGDYYKNYQGEFTRKAQQAAETNRKYQALENEAKQVREENARYRQHYQSQQTQTAQKQGASEIDQLKSLAYLSGEDAARVVQGLETKFQAREQREGQLVQALGLLFQRLQQSEQKVNGLYNQSQSTGFESRIDETLKTLGIPAGFKDIAKEIYLAYEGDDLPNEFPNILKNRYDQIRTVLGEDNKRRADEARKQQFVPGRGGQGSPGKPLNNLATGSSKEVADALWESMVNRSET